MREVSAVTIDRILNLTMKMRTSTIMLTRANTIIFNSLVREIIKTIRTRISMRRTGNRMISMMNRIRMNRMKMIRISMKIMTMMIKILTIQDPIEVGEIMVKLVRR